MTQELQTIAPKQYFDRKGIKYRENGNELITRCLFNDCDQDSQGNEAHLYINSQTGQYHCKKCGEKGNLITLAKHLGDSWQDVVINQKTPKPTSKNKTKFDACEVDSCVKALPDDIRSYLKNRGICEAVVKEYKLGWGKFYGKYWITIPIKDIHGNYTFFKLRQDPKQGNEKITFPKGIEAQLYGWESLNHDDDKLVICEGELDRLALLSHNINAITSTHGAMTFKKSWCDKIPDSKQIYICFDNDDAGKKGAERVAKMLHNNKLKIYIITLPPEVGDGGDVTDYLTKLKGDPQDLFTKYAKPYPEKIDTAQFQPLNIKDLSEILGLTIKQDEENKIVTFLCELSAFTENAQFNISYNAPSSTGKSYIPTEIARLFPQEDVIELAYCSPTAFFHDVGEYDKEMKGYLVDLSRKILIFLDQPHNELLARLRPLLSHDKKQIMLKITDKSQKFGLKTKNVLLKGYPSVIFCTAGLRIDEQEATRFLLLSPEINQEKIRQGIWESVKKEADYQNYKNRLEDNLARKHLKQRIKAIKSEHITEIKISGHQTVIDRFLKQNTLLKPRHQRDIKRLVSIIKSLALLNLWWRERDGTVITANQEDIEQAFAVWKSISVSQELNLPPYIYKLYQEVILQAWREKKQVYQQENKCGLERQEVLQKHFDLYGRMLDTSQLRQQILPMLETAGLIVQEQALSDKRKILIYPTLAIKQNNSVTKGGVKHQ